MFCKKCGTQYEGPVCPTCGMPAVSVQSPLVWSILATLCCCLPFGIVSIVYAAKVNSLAAAGAFAEAQDAANKAKMWAWIAFGLGLVSNIAVILFQIVLAAAAETGAGGF